VDYRLLNIYVFEANLRGRSLRRFYSKGVPPVGIYMLKVSEKLFKGVPQKGIVLTLGFHTIELAYISFDGPE